VTSGEEKPFYNASTIKIDLVRKRNELASTKNLSFTPHIASDTPPKPPRPHPNYCAALNVGAILHVGGGRFEMPDFRLCVIIRVLCQIGHFTYYNFMVNPSKLDLLKKGDRLVLGHPLLHF